MILLARGAVVPVAIAAARRAKIVAIITAVSSVTCLLFGIADVLDSPSRRNDVAALFWVGVFGLACALAILRVKRATAAARRAAADLGSTWTFAGKLVVAADDRGQPLPEHSFRITRTQRTMVLSGRE